MAFSLTRTIRGLVAPSHRLSISFWLWRRILDELRRRGGARRESGAFLLGSHCANRGRIVDVQYYDSLDPRCLDTGAVLFDGRRLADLFAYCAQHGLTVLADVHTHPGPGPAAQSYIDRENPMIRQVGHAAMIVPHLAMRGDVGLGLFTYHGGGRWTIERGAMFYRGWL